MTDMFDLVRARYLIATTLEKSIEQKWSRETGRQVAIAELIMGREERNRKHLENMVRGYGGRPMGDHYLGYLDVLDLSPEDKAVLTGRPLVDFVTPEGSA